VEPLYERCRVNFMDFSVRFILAKYTLTRPATLRAHPLHQILPSAFTRSTYVRMIVIALIVKEFAGSVANKAAVDVLTPAAMTGVVATSNRKPPLRIAA